MIYRRFSVGVICHWQRRRRSNFEIIIAPLRALDSKLFCTRFIKFLNAEALLMCNGIVAKPINIRNARFVPYLTAPGQTKLEINILA